jgi:outer membrane protein OmpA-like peptidoglycan-associated protein
VTALALLLLAGCGPRHRYPDGRGLTGQLEREVIALQQSVHLLEDQAANCAKSGQADIIYRELFSVLSAVGDDVSITNEGQITVISLPDAYLFGSDDLTIRDEAVQTLDLVTTALRLHVAHRVLIEGHTADVMPSPIINKLYNGSLWDLSYGRAASIRDAMVQRFSIPEDRLALLACGPYEPVVSNDTTAGQARNRRVVLRIYPPQVRR